MGNYVVLRISQGLTQKTDKYDLGQNESHMKPSEVCQKAQNWNERSHIQNATDDERVVSGVILLLLTENSEMVISTA